MTAGLLRTSRGFLRRMCNRNWPQCVGLLSGDCDDVLQSEFAGGRPDKPRYIRTCHGHVPSQRSIHFEKARKSIWRWCPLTLLCIKNWQ